MRLIFVLPCIFLTMLCWGIYGPAIHAGQFAVDAGAPPSSLKPFICVGIAYVLIAVLVPLILLSTKGEKGSWSLSGIVWSLLAGAAGAVAALGIILAFKFRGAPVYVMPLVFGCAPVVHTFVTMLLARSFKQASWIFYLGVLIVALGAGGVMMFKPTDAIKVVEEQGKLIVTVRDVQVTAENPEDLKEKSLDAYEAYRKQSETRLTPTRFAWVTMFVAIAAFCWGAYGPVLHRGQMKMDGSRLRPFICVGLAYFLIAVIVPLLMLSSPLGDPEGWHFVRGSAWSLIGGAAGAIGALGIIYAFNFGGKPVLVMPLVFGCAPVVNTFVTTWVEGLSDKVSTSFYLSLMLVIAGAVTVLVFAPRPKPKSASAGKAGSDKVGGPKVKEKPVEREPETEKDATSGGSGAETGQSESSDSTIAGGE